MSLLGLIALLVFVGVILWAINQLVPMDARVKNILNVLVVVFLVLYLLQAFGLLPSLTNVRLN